MAWGKYSETWLKARSRSKEMESRRLSVGDISVEEIDRRFEEALKVIKASRQFTTDPYARTSQEPHVSRHRISPSGWSLT